MQLFTQGHALIIGVGRYADSRWDVPTATADAEAVHKVLVDPQYSAYPPGQVTLLRDAEATKAGILAALNALADRTTAKDTVLISFTGHGAPGTSTGYFLGTHDMLFNGQTITNSSAFSLADLGRALRQIKAERVVLIINACFSGSAAPNLTRGGITPPAQLGNVLDEAEGRKFLTEASDPNTGGRAIITASKPDQLSLFMTDRTLSFFGQALVDALRGGDGSGAQRGVIGMFELYDTIYRQTRLSVWQARNSEQTPLLTLLQGEGNFAVARYPGAATSTTQALLPKLPGDLPIREVPRDVISAVGDGAVAVKAEPGSNVNIDQRRSGVNISLGNNNTTGDISFRDVAGGDIFARGEDVAESKNTDPAALLPRLSRDILQAKNVDQSLLENISDAIDAAVKALSRGNSARAKEKIQEALELLAPLRANGYINSKARKLEAVRDAL